MNIFEPVDDWFNKGFVIEKTKKPRKSPSTKKKVTRIVSAGFNFSASAKSDNIKSVINRSPEVVVKITGKSTGLKTLKNHLNYISRNGQLELLDENGNLIQGKPELMGLQNQLKALQIPNESTKREYLHVLFSMPANTHVDRFKQSVAEFCKEEFGQRRYVMAFHDDTDHTHIHLAVSTRNKDDALEARLSPRKDDLFRWRQGFADKLRLNGIDAAASERRHRFNFTKADNGVIRQIADKTTRVPLVVAAQDQQIKQAVKEKKRPTNPALNKANYNKEVALTAWQAVANNYEAAGDVVMAAKVREFMAVADKPIVTRNQQKFDDAIEFNKDIGQGKGRDKEGELEIDI